MNKFTVISKIAGTAAAGLLLFDAHSQGKHASRKEQINMSANRLPDEYLNSMRLDKQSAVTNKLKKRFFRWQLDTNIPEFFAGIKGYFKGATENLTTNIIPAALATGAILFKKAGRFCAVGLALCGVKYLLNDVFSIGKPKILGDKI